jgi:hypothetical protein
VSALSTPNGEEGYNSSTDLNPITNSSILLQCTQARSPHPADKTPSKTPSEMLYVNLFHINHNTVPICELKNKYPKRVALATKYFKVLPPE